ncbi:Gfo/Idh/MocA family oxidoreductase [Alloacidobacterium dinghuense]|uniref:Gfo/Idh/MocA family oxidoreductase n=1 Tax=Alloacidobacterium dinghuense TaxID=2763107 RepID=A0A7G8BE37_9BACT|nr:Gfo/Idh/MocA family oxidoreductase [Alloacidobacterium dinghuense]QNI30807.1 Gfo/Idh/MocA family oxidoreductase [Alloacidobacterium dinghuense]
MDFQSRVEQALREAKPPLPRQPRSIIVVGTGGIVHDAHLPAYQKAGFPVAALVDANSARAATLAAKHSVPLATSSLDEAIAKSPKDSIFDVAVPAGAILDVLPLLPDGSAALIQKPMGNTLAEAEQILALCRKKGMTAAVNFQLRYAPVMLAARRITDAGLLGELHDLEVRVNVFMPWELWGFLATAPRLEILYHSIHYIDLVRSWFGNPERVLAKTVRHPKTANLAATKSLITLDYGDWKRVYIATNHGHKFKNSQHSYVQWEGTEGALHAVMGVNLDYPRGRPDTLSIAKTDEDWQTLPTVGNWFPDAFIGSMGSLQAYVTGDTDTLPTSVEDAIDTMRTVEAAYISNERDGVPLMSH